MDLGSLVIRAWKPFTRIKGRLVRRALRLSGQSSASQETIGPPDPNLANPGGAGIDNPLDWR
jgi:hypothetical protein